MLDKIGLSIAVWSRFLVVKWLLRRGDIASVARKLGHSPIKRHRGRQPVNLGRAVWKALSAGPLRPRCLPVALVHYELLVEQGLAAELVIGIADDAESSDAHAWVEIEGVDVGPPRDVKTDANSLVMVLKDPSVPDLLHPCRPGLDA